MFLRRPMTRHVILRKTASNNSHVIRQQARVTAGPVCGFFHTEEYSDICLIVLMWFYFPPTISLFSPLKRFWIYFFGISQLMVINYKLFSCLSMRNPRISVNFSSTFVHVYKQS